MLNENRQKNTFFRKLFFGDGEKKSTEIDNFEEGKASLCIIMGKRHIILSGVAIRNFAENFHIGKGKLAHPYQ